MFTFIKGLHKHYFSKPTYKILVIGLENSGKTHFLNLLKKQNKQKYLPLNKIKTTVGLNLAQIEHEDFSLVFWDLGGKRILRSIWKKYYLDCHGIIYMVDGTDKERLEESQKCLEELDQKIDIDGVPILIFLNKSDDPKYTSIDQANQLFKLEGIINREITMMPLSCLNNDDLHSKLSWLYLAMKAFYKRVMKN